MICDVIFSLVHFKRTEVGYPDILQQTDRTLDVLWFVREIDAQAEFARYPISGAQFAHEREPAQIRIVDCKMLYRFRLEPRARALVARNPDWSAARLAQVLELDARSGELRLEFPRPDRPTRVMLDRTTLPQTAPRRLGFPPLR